MDAAVVSGDLTVAKLKKDAFRDNFVKFQERSSSLLFLSLQWKDLEEHYSAVQDALERKCRGLSSAEESLREIFREVEAKQHEFRAIEALIEERCKELDATAEEYGEKYRSAIEEKVRVMGREIERRLEEIEEKERTFESQSAALQRLIKERFEEVESKEKQAEGVSAKLNQRLKELKLEEKQYEERVREFELANSRFESEQQKLSERLREVGAKERLTTQRLGELDSKNKEVEERSRELELSKSRFELDRGVFNERSKELELKEKRVEDSVAELELKNKQLEVRLGELELSRRIFKVNRGKLDDQLREFESKMKKIDGDRKKLDEQVKELETHRREFDERVEKFTLMESESKSKLEAKMSQFDSDREKLDEQLRELETNKREFDNLVEKFALKENESKRKLEIDREKSDHRLKELDLKEKQLEGWDEELVSSRKVFSEQVEMFQLMEKKLEECSKEIELKAKQLEEKCIRLDKEKLRACVTVDGKHLQVLLNECRNDHERIRDGVLFILRMCPDPARVVLDAMQGFFPPHLKKGDVEFKGNIVRESCILLLEQLMKISPDIKDDSRSEARKLSSDWYIKIKPNNEYSSHIMGFLLLIAVYKCHNPFGVNALIPYVKVIAHWGQSPELCRILGFRDEVPGLILDILGKRHLLPAIKFACTFELCSEFPPEPILKEYMDTSRSAFKAIYYSESSTLEEKTKATNKRIRELKAARRCILDHELQLGYRPANINEAISALEKQLADHIKAAAAVNTTEVMEPDGTRRGSSGISSPVPLSVPVSAICSMAERAAVLEAPEMPLQQQKNMEYPQTEISQQAACRVVADSGNYVQEAEPGQQVGSPIHQDSLAKGEATLDVGSTTPENAPPELRKCHVDLSLEIQRMLLRGDMEDKVGREIIVFELTSSSEPAELVLDVIEGPHLLVLEKDGSSPEVAVKGSILLLKELRGLSYKFNLQLKPRAKALAKNYKLSLARNDHLGVILLLLFLDAFRVYLDAVEITSLLDPSIWRREIPESFQLLGLQDFIIDFIRNLIGRNERLNAVEYIHAMKLESRFPVIAILKNHFVHQEKFADNLLLRRNATKFQMRAFNIKLDAARGVRKYISIYEMESEYPSKDIEECIDNLEEQKSKIIRKLELKPMKPLAGSKRKSSACCYEDENASQKNSTIKKRPWCLEKRKTKYIGSSDPDFAPPPPRRKFHPKGKRFPAINSGPLVKRTGRAQFADSDVANPFLRAPSF